MATVPITLTGQQAAEIIDKLSSKAGKALTLTEVTKSASHILFEIDGTPFQLDMSLETGTFVVKTALEV